MFDRDALGCRVATDREWMNWLAIHARGGMTGLSWGMQQVCRVVSVTGVVETVVQREKDWARCWTSWKECKECVGRKRKRTNARPQACKEWTGGGQRTTFKEEGEGVWSGR
jgi:hypothetical protein